MAHEELKMQWRLDEERYGKDAYKYWEFDFGYGWQPCHPEGPMWRKANEYRRKEPSFEPEYFSGLNWRDALPLVGKVVEFSDDGNHWTSGIFSKYSGAKNPSYKFMDERLNAWIYIRTTPETHAHPTVTLTVNGREWVLPSPETELPEKGEQFFIFYPWKLGSIEKMVKLGESVSESVGKCLVENGLVHLTESRAQAWADFWREAILGAVRG